MKKQIVEVEQTVEVENFDWVEDTPDETMYFLSMTDMISGEDVQGLDLTRAEFIELKRHLAKLRGYKAPAEAKAAAKSQGRTPAKSKKVA